MDNLKKVQIGGRVTAEINAKIEELAKSESITKSEIVEQALNYFFEENSSNSMAIAEQVAELIEQKKQLESKLDFFENCIVISTQKLDTETLAFWLEVSAVAKSKRPEYTMQRVKSLFVKAYGDIEDKYFEQAKNIKNQ